MSSEVDTKIPAKPKPVDASDKNAPAKGNQPSPFHQELHDMQRPAQPTDKKPPSTDAAQPKPDAAAKPAAGGSDAAGGKPPAAASPEAKSHLDQAVIDKKAEELHAAILKKGWFSRPDPDVSAVTQALSGTTEADRKAIEAAYQTKWGANGPADKLRSDMRANLPDEECRRAECTLNTRDGRTNDAGALMTALAAAKTDPERGSNEVRAILQNLDSKKLAQLRVDLDHDYHVKLGATLAQGNLNETTRESMHTLLKGVDNIKADDIVGMAHSALSHGDKRAFCEAIRGDSQEAKDARAKLLEEPGFKRQLQQAFLNPDGLDFLGRLPKDSEWKKAVDPVVADYMGDGKISLKTIIEKNHGGWPFNNPENTALAAQNATDSERNRFIMGKQLDETKPAKLTAEQKEAVDYYHQVHQAFKGIGTDRETAANEDKLIHGRETLVSEMAQTHSDGYTGLHLFGGHDKQDLISRAEHLSKQDWELLSGAHPAGDAQAAAEAQKKATEFRKEIDSSLASYADPGERKRIMEMLDQKAKAPSYEESQQIKRSVNEVIDANVGSDWLGNTKYDTKHIVNYLGELPQESADKYNIPKPPAKNAYREHLDKFVNTQLQGAEQLEAKRLLAKVADTGKPPVHDAVDNMLMGKINGAEPKDLVQLSEKALADPALRQRLNQPNEKLSADDKQLKMQIEDSITALGLQRTPVAYYGRGGRVSSGPTSGDIHKDLFEDGHIPAATKLRMGFPSKDVIADLPSAPKGERDAVGKMLTAEERDVVEKASLNKDHKLDLADRMRLAAVDSKANPSSTGDFEGELGKLSNDEKVRLKNEYAAKYGHGDLDTDFQKSLANDQERAKFKNLLATTDGDGRQKYYENYEAMLKSESGITVDASKLTMERANDLYATSLQEYNRIYQTLPKDKQEALDKYFDASMKQYKDSKEKLAEIAVDAAITAAALAAAPFTAGASTALLISSAAAFGAAFRVGAMAAIEGHDFDSSGKNIVKQMVIGGTSAATNFFGGAGVAGALEQGAARVITKEGAVAAAKVLLKEAVANGFTGAYANVVSDLVVAPFDKNGIDLQQLERSAATGFVAGAVLPVAFKGVLKVGGVAKDLVVNLTKQADGLHIDPKNLTEAISFRNTRTGEVMHFKPGEGEPVKLTKEWLPAEVAAATTVAAAPVVADVIANNVHPAKVAPVEVSTPAPPVKPVAPVAPPPPSSKAPTTGGPAEHVDPRPVAEKPAAPHDTKPAEPEPKPADSNAPKREDKPEGEPGEKPEAKKGDKPEDKPGEEKPGEEKPKDGKDAPNEHERPVTPEVPPIKLMNPLERREFAEQIAAKFADKPVTEKQFKDIFDGEYSIGGVTRKLNDNERQIVSSLMEHSMPSLNNKALNSQVAALKGELDKIPGWKYDSIKVPAGDKFVDAQRVNVYVLDGSSDGNGLAHLFQKNTGVQVRILPLDGQTLTKMKEAAGKIERIQSDIKRVETEFANNMDGHPFNGKKTAKEYIASQTESIDKLRASNNLDQGIIFDDLSHATPDQKAVLNKMGRLAVADLNGFSHGPNIFDMSTAGLVGNNEGLKEKLGGLLQRAEQIQAREGIDAQTAADRALKEASATGAKAALPDGNYHVVKSEPAEGALPRAESRAKAAEGLDAKTAEQFKEKSLYDEMTQPPVTAEQMENFLGQMNAEQQMVAARLMRDGLDINTYSSMMKQAKELQAKILKDVPGGDPKNMLIITGLEANGSSYMANTLYARANGLSAENFVSANDLKLLNAAKVLTPEMQALKAKLESKRLVYLDDYSISGQQIPKVLNSAANEGSVLSNLQKNPMLRRADGSPLIDGITVGTFGSYEVPAKTNPWTNYKKFPNIVAGPGGAPTLNIHLVDSPVTYQNLMDKPLFEPGTPEYKTLTKWSANTIYESPVKSGLITPYGGPNNNIAYLQALIESRSGLGLPQRYPQANWKPVLDGDFYDKRAVLGDGADGSQ